MKKPLGIGAVRVSTDRQFHEGESLDNQAERIERAASNDGVELVRFFVEHYSGRKADRTVIEEMMAFLDENPEIKWVYINEINRFSRGGGDVYLNLILQLRKRGVGLKDVTGIIQNSINTLDHLGLNIEYDWSRVSPSRPAEVLQAEYAKQEVSQILTRMIGQEIRLAMQGYQIRKSDFGYRNVRITRPNGKPAMIMEPREPEASWIRAIFELRAEGGWTDEAICEHVNAMGYKSRRRNKRDKASGKVIGYTGESPLTPKQLQRFILNTTYCAVKMERWTNNEPIPSKSPGLVTLDLWNKANRGQRRLALHADGTYTFEKAESRKKRTWKENTEFLLRHVVMCPECKKPFWASKSKGRSGARFGYFHCARDHKRISYSQSEFERTIGKYLSSIEYKPAFLGMFREAVREVWIEKNKNHGNEVELVDQHIADLKLKQSNLLETIMTTQSVIVREKLESEVEALEAAIKEAEKTRPSAWLTEQQIDEFFDMARKRLEHPAQIPKTAGTQAQIEAEWSTVFSSPPTLEEIKSGTPDLTLIYRLSVASETDKNQMVTTLSLHWNTFVAEVHIWLDAKWIFSNRAGRHL